MNDAALRPQKGRMINTSAARWKRAQALPRTHPQLVGV
jgi:hypothetical protein